MLTQWNRQLPAALKESAHFQALTEQEATSFQARLAYIEEILQRIEGWLALDNEWVRGENDPRAFLDPLELDLAINQNPCYERDKRISCWLIHSTWIPEKCHYHTLDHLSNKLINRIEESLPPLSCKISIFTTWLSHQADALKSTLNELYDADHYEKVYAHLIALDCLLTKLLLGLITARMNEYWESA